MRCPPASSSAASATRPRRSRTCPYDEAHGHFLNDHGQINDQLYCVGWARRGPTGTIGTNRPDGYEVAEQVAAAMPADADGGKNGGEGLDALLAERGVEATSFDDWRAIEKAEEAAGPRRLPARENGPGRALAEGARPAGLSRALRCAEPPSM